MKNMVARQVAVLALTVGGSLSLAQFAVLHDVIHGGAVRGRGDPGYVACRTGMALYLQVFRSQRQAVAYRYLVSSLYI